MLLAREPKESQNTPPGVPEGRGMGPLRASPEQYQVLHAVAQLRAHRQGGTTSVSAVIRDLVEENIDALRAEAKPLLDIG